MSQKSYKGLPNIGATCYINSFLQTLFMTPEFRDGIYSWTYNQKKHPKRQDSILFQLQKLFSKLQLGYSDISTKQLVKSFQWNEDEAMYQQDIQQFNRILFQALQKSFIYDKDNKSIIKELYEGELAQYTKCLECHTQSIREEIFQDIILIIKNLYEKIYNPSLQHSLQRYIKPELLDENNLYQCSHCNKKVRAQRGVKFIRLPKLLNLVMQRFHFDYETMTRNKINDKCAFPFILNFNHYFNGYQQIPNRLSEDSSQYFLSETISKKVQPKPNFSNKTAVKSNKVSSQPAVAGKLKTKPSANTKSFLQQMRKKRMNQQSEDLIYVSGNQQQATIQTKSTSSQVVNNFISVNNGSIDCENLVKEDKVNEAKIIQVVHGNHIPVPPPLSIVPQKLQQIYKSNIIVKKSNNFETMTEQLQSVLQQRQKLVQQKQKNNEQLSNRNRQQINLYLKDGPLVYQLYSILVHSGTSHAGHYYSYIKSFENDRWYHFNDDRVQQINVLQIEKTFGPGFANAYVLYYRIISEEKFKLQYSIPNYIKKIIEEEQEISKLRKIVKLNDIQNTLILKIYFQLGVKTIQILKNSTLELLYQKAKELFNIKTQGKQCVKMSDNGTYIKQSNIRIRLFNPLNQMKLDTYTGRDKNSLQELNIKSYQNFILETKGDSEQFQQYVAGYMTIRIALWQQNTKVESLDEKHLYIHKISIRKESKMLEVQNIVQSKRKQCLEQKYSVTDLICIIKRHQNDEYLYHEIVNLQPYYQKTADSVGIFENQILFVELDDEILNWPRQFQNEINRITIKYINSIDSQQQSITIDSRITLNQLKIIVCTKINQPLQEIIVRRGNRSGLQMKNGQASLKQNRFINGTTLYLQKGLPAKLGQIRIQLFLAYDANLQSYNRLHEFEFIADVPIDTNLKASEVKEVFKKIVNKVKGIELQNHKIRIRQKVNDKIGKIYREKPMKQQQLIQKRQIAIEFVEDKMELKDYSIYVRVWDQFSWKLSEKYEFIITKSTTVKQLSSSIYKRLKQLNEAYLIEPEQMDICRILSIHKFNIIDLVDMEYFGMVSEMSAFGEPLFVNSDGLLYIVKQTGIQPRELTAEEQKIFGGKIKTTIRPTKGRSSNSSQPQKKEKGISIKVIEKIEEEQEKN